MTMQITHAAGQIGGRFNMSSTAHSSAGSNDPISDRDKARREFGALTRELGREAAAGRDALPKLALAVVEAAHAGLLSLDKDPNDPDKRDDAAKVFEEYATAEGKKAIHERTPGGLKANISKLRQLIAMGVEQIKFDPVQAMNDAVFARQDMKDDTTVKLKAAYAAFVDVARTQSGLNRQISADEIKACIVKPESDPKTLEDVLKKIQKLLDGVVTGENAEKVKDQSEDVIIAQEAIARRLTFVSREAKVAELQALLDKDQ